VGRFAMGVLFQAFYWDCPKREGKEFEWWNFVKSKIPELGGAGFTALWLPPANKAANLGGMSMGYDVYDYFDLGGFDQKGTVKTWFGAQGELVALIDEAHRYGLQVYADLVLNHNSGADEQQDNPILGQPRWTKFTPKSGRFPRDWTCFHPSPYEEVSDPTFGDMPDLCHKNPRVCGEILTHAKWLVEEIGFDGFRYDFVKGFGGWLIRALHDLEYRRGDGTVTIFGVGECWDRDEFIDIWLDSVNCWSSHHAGAFDFPLRYRLKELCDCYGFSLRRLAEGGTLMKDRPQEAVTFVDNHDFRDDRNPEIVGDKMLAYAVILTHEGYPCVYWKDYLVYGLALPGEAGGIERLVKVHEQYAGGGTSLLSVDDNLYVMQRDGHESLKGLILVLNNLGEGNGRRVRSRWRNARLVPQAWRGKDALAAPQAVTTDGDGWVELAAPPRGYVVYVPE